MTCNVCVYTWVTVSTGVALGTLLVAVSSISEVGRKGDCPIETNSVIDSKQPSPCGERLRQSGTSGGQQRTGTDSWLPQAGEELSRQVTAALQDMP